MPQTINCEKCFLALATDSSERVGLGVAISLRKLALLVRRDRFPNHAVLISVPFDNSYTVCLASCIHCHSNTGIPARRGLGKEKLALILAPF